MNGYVRTATGAEALAAFGKPGVRHAAVLDSGQGFVAFDGEVPADGDVWENVPTDAFFWPFRIIRRPRVEPTDRDIFGLYTSEAFQALRVPSIVMASQLTNDLILAATLEREPSALWTAQTVTWLDVRSTQASLV